MPDLPQAVIGSTVGIQNTTAYATSPLRTRNRNMNTRRKVEDKERKSLQQTSTSFTGYLKAKIKDIEGERTEG